MKKALLEMQLLEKYGGYRDKWVRSFSGSEKKSAFSAADNGKFQECCREILLILELLPEITNHHGNRDPKHSRRLRNHKNFVLVQLFCLLFYPV